MPEPPPTGLSETARNAIRATLQQVLAPGAVDPERASPPITIDGRTIAVQIATVPGHNPAMTNRSGARLRDDRVARRVLSDLEAAVGPHVANGRSVVLTLGAPIRVPGQLVEVLTNALVDRLAEQNGKAEDSTEILGNRVRFCILDEGSWWSAKVVGFVFRSGPSPGDLVTAVRSLRDAIARQAEVWTIAGQSGEGWLVLTGNWIGDIATYRRAFSRVIVPHSFEKVLIVFGDRIETLAERAPLAQPADGRDE